MPVAELPSASLLASPSSLPSFTVELAAHWHSQVLRENSDKDTSRNSESRNGPSGAVSSHSSLAMGAQGSPFVPRSPFEDMRVGLVSASMLGSAPWCLPSSPESRAWSLIMPGLQEC